MKNAAFVFVTIVLLASVPQASARQRSACDALVALSQPNTYITLARSIGSSADLDLSSSDRPGRGQVGDLPPFCRVAATLRPSADSDIKIEVCSQTGTASSRRLVMVASPDRSSTPSWRLR
jgi:hypothetical protein